MLSSGIRKAEAMHPPPGSRRGRVLLSASAAQPCQCRSPGVVSFLVAGVSSLGSAGSGARTPASREDRIFSSFHPWQPLAYLAPVPLRFQRYRNRIGSGVRFPASLGMCYVLLVAASLSRHLYVLKGKKWKRFLQSSGTPLSRALTQLRTFGLR